MKFTDLKLLPELQWSVKESGYTTPTPIQALAIPSVLEGKDLLGLAQTGTGKTAAFSLPILQLLTAMKNKRKQFSPRCLVLTPTRELALQVYNSFCTYGKNLNLKHAVVFGGVGQGNQVQALSEGVDVLVATPGRLLDLMEQNFVKLNLVEIFVLDEADQMLDMGFMPDVKKIIVDIPDQRQTLMFSATMPKEIQGLANRLLMSPKIVEIVPEIKTAEKVEQEVMYVKKEDKLSLLFHLLENNDLFKVLVFVEMKHQASRITDRLVAGGVQAVTIHSERTQAQRQKALDDFKSNYARVLVATDIAARGIDVDGITHVINYDLSHIPESYIHRIGRTGRAGLSGKAITFCTGFEKSYLFAIEKTINLKITEVLDQPFHSHEAHTTPVISVGKAKAMMEAHRAEQARKRSGRGGGGRPSAFKSGGRSGSSSGGKSSSSKGSGGEKNRSEHKPSFGGKPSSGKFSGGKPSGGKPNAGKPNAGKSGFKKRRR